MIIYNSSPNFNNKSLLEWGVTDSMRILHCTYMQVVHIIYIYILWIHLLTIIHMYIANTALSVHNIGYKNWGVPTILSSTPCDKQREMFVLWLQLRTGCPWKEYNWLMYIMPYCTLRKSYCRRSLVSVGRHILFLLNTASPTANMCMKHECPSVSDYSVPLHIHISKFASDLHINVDNPSMQWDHCENNSQNAYPYTQH